MSLDITDDRLYNMMLIKNSFKSNTLLIVLVYIWNKNINEENIGQIIN